MMLKDKDSKTSSLRVLSVQLTLPAAMSLTRRSLVPLLLLTLLCLLPTTTFAYLEKRCNLEDRREGPAAGGICGSRLPEIIRLTCMVKQRKRRSTDNAQPKSLDIQKELDKIKFDKSVALSYLTKRSGGNHGEQGITCECCYNRCSLTELLQYC